MLHSDTPLTCMTSYCMIRTSTQSDKKHCASDYQYIQGGHMYQLDFDKPIHVYFSGIGGISMSGLAQILRSRGFEVSGSDRAASSITDELAADGIKVIIGQKKENITPDIDLVVFTAAIRPDNPEYIAVMSRFPHYSINNCILIASQCPEASYVCGYKKWHEFTRNVVKGESGIMIFAPIKGKVQVEEPIYDANNHPVLNEDGTQAKEKVEREYKSFRPCYVFDVSQTEGDPLPTLANQSQEKFSLPRHFMPASSQSGFTTSSHAPVSILFMLFSIYSLYLRSMRASYSKSNVIENPSEIQ